MASRRIANLDRPDERIDFLRAVGTGFGATAPDENDEYPVHLLPADRCLFVRDGETIVLGGIFRNTTDENETGVP